jgi:hypothetical protein
MTTFNPSILKPASKSIEFSAVASSTKRTPKDVLLAGIGNQLTLFKEPKKDGRRWFQSGKSETAFSIRYSNKALVLVENETKVVVPTAQFEGALAYYKGEVIKGTFDLQLAELAKGVDARKVKMAVTRAAKKTAKV